MNRVISIVLLSMALFIFMSVELLADTFPSKPINLWVGWGGGSGTDISQRAIANMASKALNQPILVSNVTGGGGTLVLGRLKAEKPDGYTIANTSSATLGRIPHLQPVPYNAQDPLKDFIPIMSYSYYLYGLAVKSDSPWKTFEEFIAYAKANPGKVRYSTSGVGTGQHLAMSECPSIRMSPRSKRKVMILQFRLSSYFMLQPILPRRLSQPLVRPFGRPRRQRKSRRFSNDSATLTTSRRATS